MNTNEQQPGTRSPLVPKIAPPRVHPMTRWHRLVAIVSTAMLMVTITTGLFLNHTDAFEFNRTYLESRFINALYGLDSEIPAGFWTTYGWVSEFGGAVYLDAMPIAAHDAPLVGAVVLEDYVVVGFTDGIWLATSAGELVEKLGTMDGITLPVTTLALNDGHLIVQSDARVVEYDMSAGTFADVGSDLELPRQEAMPLPQAIIKELERAHRGVGVSLERFLYDLHSGRIFGGLGVLIVDLATLCALFLSISGIYMYFKFKRNGLPPREISNK